MSTAPPEEPTFDLSPQRIEELAALADTAAADADSWRAIASVLKSNDFPPDVEAVAVAFDYVMRYPAKGTGAPVFNAASTIDGRSYPMPPESLPPNVPDLWDKVAANATAAPVRARLRDLLFTIRRQPQHEHATSACIAYLEQGRTNHSAHYRASSLIRALDLSRQMSRNDLANDVVTQMITEAREGINSDDPKPGVPLQLITRLVGEKNPPDAVDDLLASARACYNDNPFIEAQVAELQRRRAKGNNEILARIDREVVTIWLQAAEASSGLRKVGHLKKAIDYAQRHGLNDLLATATTNLQDITIDELDMHTFSVPVDIPAEVIEQWIRRYTSSGDWRSSLMRISDGEVGEPPSGNADTNRAMIEQNAMNAGIFSRLRVEIYGGDGLPRWQPQNDEDQGLQQLCDIESSRMQFVARLYAKALHEIGSLHQPSREELQHFFANRPALPGDLPRAVADALLRYWSKDYEGCAYVLVPKIEAMLRALARLADEPTYKTQRNRTPGKYVGMAVLLQILGKHGLDESWGRYLNTLLCSPMGWNLRNELAHGFVDTVPAPIAALVLQATLYLASLETRGN
jgi:hypothetical protein